MTADDTSALFDASAGEEPSVPSVPESRGNTAALFCIEALGVPPPPSKGWVPREDKDSKQNSKRSKTPGDKSPVVEWYRNVTSTEWIYHTAEDMYYHLPSSSLWERRHVECSVPTVEEHTYFRVDAKILQTLSHFAMSLDVGLLPLAFKAWVRFMRKKKDRHFGVPAPPASPGGSKPGRKSSKTPGSGPAAQTLESSDATATGAKGPDIAGSGTSNSNEMHTTSLAAIEAPSVIKDAKGAMAALRASRSFEDSPRDQAEEPAVAGTAGAGEPVETAFVLEEGRVAESQDQNPNAEFQPLASKGSDDSHRKGLFCLRCFRSRKPSKENAADSAVLQASAGQGSAPRVSSNGEQQPGPAAETKLSEPTVNAGGNGSTVDQQQETIPNLTCDTADRHMRRLDAFLDLVKRNPQKLVEHIEKRRQGKTTTLGAFVA